MYVHILVHSLLIMPRIYSFKVILFPTKVHLILEDVIELLFAMIMTMIYIY